MSEDQFWSEAMPYALQAHQATGLFLSLILAQFADETEYGGSDWSVHHNPGNVGSFDGRPVASFRTLEAGTQAYIQLMNEAHQFGPTIRRGTTPFAQAFLLGDAHPVWASGGYRARGGPPGSALVSIINEFDLTRFDAGNPRPSPPPPSLEGDDVTSVVSGTQLHVWAMVNGQNVHWWQDSAGTHAGVWYRETLP